VFVALTQSFSVIIFDLISLMGIKFCTQTLPFSAKGCLSGAFGEQLH